MPCFLGLQWREIVIKRALVLIYRDIIHYLIIDSSASKGYFPLAIDKFLGLKNLEKKKARDEVRDNRMIVATNDNANITF